MRRALVLWTDPGDSRGRSGLCKRHVKTEGLWLARRFGETEDHRAAAAELPKLGRAHFFVPG